MDLAAGACGSAGCSDVGCGAGGAGGETMSGWGVQGMASQAAISLLGFGGKLGYGGLSARCSVSIGNFFFHPLVPIYVLIPLVIVPTALFAHHHMSCRDMVRGRLASVVRVSIVALIILLIGARPMVSSSGATQTTNAIDIIFVVDDTLSMNAQDGEVGAGLGSGQTTSVGSAAGGTTLSRFEVAEIIVSDLMSGELAGCSYELVTFDEDARVLVPLTNDDLTISDALDTAERPDEHYTSGTSMSALHDELLVVLESASQRTDRKTCVVLISDGEPTTDVKSEASGKNTYEYQDLSQYIDSGLVIGVGSDIGATIPSEDGGNIVDGTTGQDGISYLEEDDLKTIASQMGISYAHASDTAAIEAACDDMLTGAVRIQTLDDVATYGKDVGWVFVPIVFVLIGWELIAFIRRYA